MRLSRLDSVDEINLLRGAITKKTGKIWEKFPISIWEFEKRRGGGLNFSKMSEFQLFCNYFAISPL